MLTGKLGKKEEKQTTHTKQGPESQDYKDGITSRRRQCHGNAKDANEILKREIKIYCGFYNGTRMQRACYAVQDCQNIRM